MGLKLKKIKAECKESEVWEVSQARGSLTWLGGGRAVVTGMEGAGGAGREGPDPEKVSYHVQGARQATPTRTL